MGNAYFSSKATAGVCQALIAPNAAPAVAAEITTCPHCRAESRGSFPDDMPGPLQYGHGILAFATHLMAAQMVPGA